MKWKVNKPENVTKMVAGYPCTGGKVYDTKDLVHRVDVKMEDVTDDAVKKAAEAYPEIEIIEEEKPSNKGEQHDVKEIQSERKE